MERIQCLCLQSIRKQATGHTWTVGSPFADSKFDKRSTFKRHSVFLSMLCCPVLFSWYPRIVFVQCCFDVSKVSSHTEGRAGPVGFSWAQMAHPVSFHYEQPDSKNTSLKWTNDLKVQQTTSKKMLRETTNLNSEMDLTLWFLRCSNAVKGQWWTRRCRFDLWHHHLFSLSEASNAVCHVCRLGYHSDLAIALITQVIPCSRFCSVLRTLEIWFNLHAFVLLEKHCQKKQSLSNANVKVWISVWISPKPSHSASFPWVQLSPTEALTKLLSLELKSYVPSFDFQATLESGGNCRILRLLQLQQKNSWAESWTSEFHCWALASQI